MSQLKFPLLMLFLTISCQVTAQRHSELLKLENHQVQVTHWNQNYPPEAQSSVLLISGPTDNWNSDSAWFARLAPKLAQKHRVISVDRASQSHNPITVSVGYAQFGLDLGEIIRRLKLENVQIIAFASSNIALHHYFQANLQHPVNSVIMIDPDVLTDYSISRYKRDADPFKENEQQYLEYISAGKYNQQAQQKNEQELQHLQELSNDDQSTDWEYVDVVFKNRLILNNLLNSFREIAFYDRDLDSAAKIPFPNSVSLTIIDTDFEQAYIDKNEKPEDRDGLIRWKKEAETYYHQMTKSSSQGKYLYLPTQEHLLPFSDPELLINLLD